jgi:hypothetical protein
MIEKDIVRPVREENEYLIDPSTRHWRLRRIEYILDAAIESVAVAGPTVGSEST